MTTPSAARALARERRDAREPHTLCDSSYLESQRSPQLNSLNGSARANPDATASSSVLQRFSSVSPQHAGFSSANDSGGGGLFPAPFSLPAWPQDVPWMPPPPPLRAPDTSVQWPTPRDIPLPSSFPFPPFLIPPFPPPVPGAAGAPLGAPPPPWPPFQQTYVPPQADKTQQTVKPQQTEKPQRARASREENRPQRAHSAARSAQLRPESPRRERSSSCNSSVESCGISWAQSLRCARPPSKPVRSVSTSHHARSKTSVRPPQSHLPEQRRYYTSTRAVKGETPQLAAELERRRTASRSRAHSSASATRKNSIPRNRPRPAAKDTERHDARVGEYAKGIEDLYQRLRESYEEFQRDPSKFVSNASELKGAALAAAPPVQTLFDETPYSLPSNKHSTPNDGETHTKPERRSQLQLESQLPHPSVESQKLREELIRLEMQWQRLEELKRVSTGERGARPVEMWQEGSHGAAPSGSAAMREIETRGAGRSQGTLSQSATPGAPVYRIGSETGDAKNQPFTRDQLLGLVRERKAMMN